MLNVKIGGDMLFDGVEKAAEFLRPGGAPMHLPMMVSSTHVRGAKSRVVPVPLIIMVVPFGLPRVAS